MKPKGRNEPEAHDDVAGCSSHNITEASRTMIETDRLILRLMNETDIDDMLKIFTDRNVMRSFDLQSFSREQMEKWVNRNLDHQNKYGYGLFSVILKSNQELIGDCGLEHTEFEGKTCVEIGYDFLSKYRNQGYATEAAQAVRDYAIEKLNIDSRIICSFIRKNNRASQRVSEKISMQKVKEYRAYNIDRYLYAFSKEYFVA
jgi:RimJ/RimL family protein N-acetyltransferase